MSGPLGPVPGGARGGSGPVGVGAGVVVATCVSMAWLSGSWPQMISTSAISASKRNRAATLVIR